MRLLKVKTVAIVTAVLLCYFGTFYSVRKHMSVTFLVKRSYPFYSVHVFYFANDAKLNQIAYWFYYPVHFWQGASESDLVAHMQSPENEAGEPPKHRVYYVRDKTRLNEYGLFGFP